MVHQCTWWAVVLEVVEVKNTITIITSKDHIGGRPR